MSKCILYDRACIDCGECDMCELDPQKRCDNCMKCVTGDAEYRAVYIDRVEGNEKTAQRTFEASAASSSAPGD